MLNLTLMLVIYDESFTFFIFFIISSFRKLCSFYFKATIHNQTQILGN